MNQAETTFGETYWNNLQTNASNHSVNLTNLTTTALFDATALAARIAGPAKYVEASRALFGATAGTIVGGSDWSATLGSVAGALVGLGVSMLLAPTAVGAVGVLVAAGVASSIASVLVDTFVDTVNAMGGDLASDPGDLLTDDFIDYDPGDSTVLPQITVTNDAPLTSYYDALSNMQSLISDLNSNYGTNHSIEDLMSIDDKISAANFLESFDDGKPNARAEVMEKLEEAVEQLKESYEENKEELDQRDPDLADNMDRISNSFDEIVDIDSMLSPIVLDLDGDGIQTVSVFENDAVFDFGAGAKEIAHGWINPGDGFLVHDKNDNGTIDNSSELFGSEKVDGFSMLVKFDDNQDGVIDEQDAIFSDLMVWEDKNSDAVSQASELYSISQLGITSLSVAPEIQNVADNYNWIPLKSSYEKEDGSTFEMSDVYFRRYAQNSTQQEEVDSNSLVVMGTTADDMLEGSVEDQMFYGGIGADTFVFTERSGNDEIADFEMGIDKIDVTGWSVENFSEIEQTSAQDSVVMSFGENSVQLHGIKLLDSSDIIF